MKKFKKNLKQRINKNLIIIYQEKLCNDIVGNTALKGKLILSLQIVLFLKLKFQFLKLSTEVCSNY